MISRSMLDACSRPHCVPSQSITCPYRVDLRTTFSFLLGAMVVVFTIHGVLTVVSGLFNCRVQLLGVVHC